MFGWLKEAKKRNVSFCDYFVLTLLEIIKSICLSVLKDDYSLENKLLNLIILWINAFISKYRLIVISMKNSLFRNKSLYYKDSCQSLNIP